MLFTYYILKMLKDLFITWVSSKRVLSLLRLRISVSCSLSLISRNSLTTFSYSLGHIGSYSFTTFQSNSSPIPILLTLPVDNGLVWVLSCSSLSVSRLVFDFKSITGASTALAFLYCSRFGYKSINKESN